MNNSTRKIGNIPIKLQNIIHTVSRDIYMDDGLVTHIRRRHPGDERYIQAVSSILSNPDYYGVSPNQSDTSFELVKILDNNVQIGIKLDSKDNYYYIATLYTITDAKLQHRIDNGRLIKYNNS